MKSVLLSCLLAIAVFALPLSSLAHPLSIKVSSVSLPNSNYNLHSARDTFKAGSLDGLNSLALTIGHQALMVTASTMLTAAEKVALDELLAGGSQTLVLNCRGVAVGGDFQLNALAGQSIASLEIPKGVTAIDNLSTSTSISFRGNLVNAGELLVESSDPHITAGTITALNITNRGLITSENQTGSLSVSLSLNALNNFANSGQVTSSGALQISAGGSIANALHMGGSAPLISGTSVMLTAGSGNFTNRGTISATTSDLTISAAGNTNLAFDNASGLLQASSGNINFRNLNYTAGANSCISGGNLSAQSVNFYAGSGAVNANVQELDGTVNINAASARVAASTNTLTLGNLNVGGDSSFRNCGGDVVLENDMTFSGQSLAISASGNIMSGNLSAPGAYLSLNSGGNVQTGSIKVNGLNGSDGGNIYISAGGLVQVDGNLEANGSKNNGGGSGGGIDIWSQGRSINVSGNVYANGRGSGSDNGGWINLYTGNGDVSVGGSVQANAFGSGDGGYIWLHSNTSNPFLVGQATVNGVSGTISAQSNSAITGGSGGSVSIDNQGAGGIVFKNFSNVSVASSSGGWGGSISLYAPGGKLVISQGTLAVNGYGGGSGGSISLEAGTIVVTGTNGAAATQALTLSANGDGTGSGGSVWLSTDASHLTIGSGAGQIAISATGGAEAGACGGGQAYVSASGNLTVDSGALTLGDAPTIYLSAGSGGSRGNLFIKGSLIADGIAGAGGSISLSCNSSTAFVIGGATTNGVTGTLSVNGSSANPGDGGSISISNEGTGGITLPNTANVSAQASSQGGNGGSLSFYTPNGTLTIAQGTLAVNGVGSTNGGVNPGGPCDVCVVPLTAQTNNSSQVSPNAIFCCVLPPSTSCCRGGSISMTAAQIVVTALGDGLATGSLNLSANGSPSGSAGNIYISQTSGDLTIGKGAGQISISAQGNATTSYNYFGYYTNSGNVSVSTGGNLTVDMKALVLGAAPNVSLSAGTAGSGNLLITGNLIADGINGNGGTVSLSSNSSSPFVIGGATKNGITGLISANGSVDAATVLLVSSEAPGNINLPQNFGSGGTISVTNNGSGGINLLNLSNISASTSSFGGNGGSITLDAGIGVLTIAQGKLSVNGGPNPNYFIVFFNPSPIRATPEYAPNSYDITGNPFSGLLPVCCSPIPCCLPICCRNNPNGTGGNIELEGSAIVVTAVGGGTATGTLNLTANGSGSGNAGSVSLVTTQGNLTIGNQAGQISISAKSGLFYSGPSQIYPPPPVLASGGGVAQPGYVIACCFFNNTYTGKVFISAGGNLTVDPSAMNVGPASGTNARGASITLIAGTGTNGGDLLVTGSLSANGSGTGCGGRIVLAANTSDTFVVSSTAAGITNGVEGTVTANGASGGSVYIASNGTQTIDSGAVQANGSNGSNGTISFMTYSDAQNQGLLCCPGAQFNGFYPPFPVLDPLPVLFAQATTGSSSNAAGSGSGTPPTIVSQTHDLGTTTSSASSTGNSSTSNDSQTNFNPTAPIATDTTNTNSHLVPASVYGNSDTPLAPISTGNVNELISFAGADENNNLPLSLQSANVLLVPDTDTEIQTPEGQIEIAQGSIALAMESSKGLAVYDLHDSHKGGIKVKSGNKVIALSPGKQALLSYNQIPDFDQSNPGSMIAYRFVNQLDTKSNIKAFVAEFSLTSAITQVAPLVRMLKSDNTNERRIAAQILKNAAILSQIGSSHGPFQVPAKDCKLDAALLPDFSR